MHEQAFGALEYDHLRALVAPRAQTPMGRARAAGLAPLSDLGEVRRALAAVTECVELRRRGAGWSFSELIDPADALARLRIEGAALDPLTLVELARLCRQASEARAAVHAERHDCPVLWDVVAGLPPALPSLAARVAARILPGGELDDRASPELARLRAEINRLRSTITRSLESLMRRSEEAIQDQLVTLRNERFVVPVRADHRGRVPGVAHGSSSSGATVFVEPLETIEANNEMQALREAEAREVARILATLTDELRRELPAVEAAAGAVTELDFVGARASMARDFDCVEPIVDEGRTLELDEARHPLLEENLRGTGREVVPVSFALDAERPVMVISGANAGGKTVVLKTAGLLALMALSGLHVPARAARFPLYRQVLADIGDRQSLAANLSTFTAHVANIRSMLELCGGNRGGGATLVLLDEVGTGTDPEEGSALGVAVVDHFRRRCGAHVVATTHYKGLKMYAAGDGGVVNASVEFDEKTLQPTYRLFVGVAGASSGLEIARRFGFPEEIVGAARAHVDEQTLAAADYLRRIKREAEEAEALRLALEEERRAVAEKYAALERDAERREREREAHFARELQRAVELFDRRTKEFLSKIEDSAVRARAEREAERRAAELKREARRAAEEQREACQRAARAGAAGGRQQTAATGVRVVRHSRGGDTEADAQLAADAAIVAESSREVRRGDRVRVASLGTTGVVERIKGGEAEVLVGSLRLTEKIENLKPLDEKRAPAGKEETGFAARLQRMSGGGTEVRLRASRAGAQEELNLIGQTTDVAADEADKFLDEAYVQGLARVRIIHGHGTGALRRVVAELLKNHPHVARFAPAPPDQGGAGATIVELKQ